MPKYKKPSTLPKKRLVSKPPTDRVTRSKLKNISSGLTVENLRDLTSIPQPSMKRHESVETIMSIPDRQLIGNINENLNTLLDTTITQIMKRSFDYNKYQFDYQVDINEDETVVNLTLKIKNKNTGKETYLEGKIMKDDDNNNFYSTIDMINSELGCKIGNFLVYIYIYILIKLKDVLSINLDNYTDDPARAALGIYNMFLVVDDDNEPVTNDSDIREYLKQNYDNYDNLDYTIQENLMQNKQFKESKYANISTFDDIPINIQNIMILSQKLYKNEGKMYYKIDDRSLLRVKQKIINLLRNISELSNDSICNPWRSDLKNILSSKFFRDIQTSEISGGINRITYLKKKGRKTRIKTKKNKNKKIKKNKTNKKNKRNKSNSKGTALRACGR